MEDQVKDTTDDPHIKKVLASALSIIKSGGIVYFKWTCAKCGERAIIDDPNTLYTELKHEEKANGEKCGYITSAKNGNIGFMACFFLKPPK